MHPYRNIEETDTYIIREFTQNIDSTELMWHRDNESRLVEVIGSTDWKFQKDNELPISMDSSIFIERHAWYRLIKGTNNLLLKIHKIK